MFKVWWERMPKIWLASLLLSQTVKRISQIWRLLPKLWTNVE